MESLNKNNLIEDFEFGVFTIQGKKHSQYAGVGKDIRLIGSELTKWKERNGHLLNFEMVTGVFDLGIETLIIGKGANGVLQVPEEIVNEIKKKGIAKVIVEKTGEACEIYNNLYGKGEKVAMLAHGTC